MLIYVRQFIKIRVVFHTLYIWNEDGDPHFFCISGTSNSLSDCSKNFKKIHVVKNFRPNVLKPSRSIQSLERARTLTISPPLCLLPWCYYWPFSCFMAMILMILLANCQKHCGGKGGSQSGKTWLCNSEERSRSSGRLQEDHQEPKR